MDKQVEKTFESLFLLEDLREIWRKTVPEHKLIEEQKKQVNEILNKIRKNLDDIQKMTSSIT